MFIIFCEECGSRNVIEDEALQTIDKQAIPCQVCNFPISTEHLIDHTGAGKVIDTSTYRLLVIDDDMAHLQLLQNSLQKEYAVQTASSGEDGIAAATTFDPNLILLDVSMPGMDGYEVCSRLKGKSETRHIPIIFVTAKTAGDDEYKGLSLGAVDYIFKPFNLKILNAKITTHLKFNAMQEELRKEITEQNKTIDGLKQDILEEESRLHACYQEKSGDKDGHLADIEQEKTNLVNIMNSLRDIISIQNTEKKIIWANRATMDNFKVTFPELLGKTCHNFYYGSSTPCAHCFFAGTTEDETTEPVDVVNEKLGQSFLQTHVPLYEENGKISGVACTAQRTAMVQENTGGALSGQSDVDADRLVASKYSEINEVISTLLISSDAICNMYRDDQKTAKLNEYIAESSDRLRTIFSDLKKRTESS